MQLIYTLSLFFFVLILLDCLTTFYGLTVKTNLKEANPLYSFTTITIGSLIKISLAVFLICLWFLISKLYYDSETVIFFINLNALSVIVVYLCVVINNLILILF